MPDLVIEFSENTYVATDNGVTRLTDLINRASDQSLWAIKWCFKGLPNGISFHKSHKQAKDFADVQIDSVPAGPAKLVEVSDWLFQSVEEFDYCWTNLHDFEDAKTYMGPTCKH